MNTLTATNQAAMAGRERGTMSIDYCCPIKLPSLTSSPPIVNGPRTFDEESHERGERINGYCECPKCGLWWPIVEEPDCWEWNERSQRWIATGWWGAAVCEACELLMADQPDGTPECYYLGD